MGNAPRLEYTEKYRRWLSEYRQNVGNAGPEPLVPAGLTPDEARTIRNQVKEEVEAA